MAGIGLLVNSNADLILRDLTLEKRLRRILKYHGMVISSQLSEHVPMAIDAFKKHEVDLICICGGDGTNLYAITSIINTYQDGNYPLIAFIRGGTINTVANYFQIRGTPFDILKRLVKTYKSKESFKIKRFPMIQVNDFYGFNFGSAMMGKFYYEYNQLEEINALSVAKFIAKFVASLIFGTSMAQKIVEPVPAHITVDGKPLPIDRFTAFFASCIEYHGFLARPCYRGSSKPGYFQLLASGMKPTDMGQQYHRFIMGKRMIHPNHFDEMAQEVRITFSKPEVCMIDGEVFETKDLVLKIGPTLNFIV